MWVHSPGGGDSAQAGGVHKSLTHLHTHRNRHAVRLGRARNPQQFDVDPPPPRARDLRCARIRGGAHAKCVDLNLLKTSGLMTRPMPMPMPMVVASVREAGEWALAPTRARGVRGRSVRGG